MNSKTFIKLSAINAFNRITAICGIIAIVLLLIEPSMRSIANSALLAITGLYLHKTNLIKYQRSISTMQGALLLAIAVITSINFLDRWKHSSKVNIIANVLGINSDALIICTWGILFFVALIELNNIIGSINDLKPYLYEIECYTDDCVRINKLCLVLIIITSFITITLLSKSSFLYPINDWVDSNCFFTVGKAILKGKVLYRDIYEQKGPLIFVLHAIAARISYRSFFGVYLFEIISCIIYLIYSTKIIQSFLQSAYVILAIPILSLLVYSSTAFVGGDSVEEFFLPIITYSLYTGIQICVRKDVDFIKVFFTGVCTALVLWSKYTCLGFFIGWIIALSTAFIKNGKLGTIVKSAFIYVMGVMSVTVPILVYFIKNKALNDLLKAYIYNNIMLYSNRISDGGQKTGLIYNIIHGIAHALHENVILGFIIVVFVLWLNRYRSKAVSSFIKITLLASCVFVYCGSVSYPYYTLVFYSYLAIGIIFPLVWISDIAYKKKRRDAYPSLIVIASVVLWLVFALFRSNNTMLLMTPKNKTPQYMFANIISQKDNATLLNYGFLDGGFYTAAGIVPDVKYFCMLNIPLDEMTDSQKNYVIDGKTDFIVTCNEELIDQKYTQVSEVLYRGALCYRLYKLTEIK